MIGLSLHSEKLLHSYIKRAMPKSVNVVNGKNIIKSYYSSYKNYHCYLIKKINKLIKIWNE